MRKKGNRKQCSHLRFRDKLLLRFRIGLGETLRPPALFVQRRETAPPIARAARSAERYRTRIQKICGARCWGTRGPAMSRAPSPRTAAIFECLAAYGPSRTSDVIQPRRFRRLASAPEPTTALVALMASSESLIRARQSEIMKKHRPAKNQIRTDRKKTARLNLRSISSRRLSARLRLCSPPVLHPCI